MIKVKQYHSEYKERWDSFITDSKNGIFLFYRDYMEYHADRFQDNSLMFWEQEQLVGVMPANCSDGVLVSHGGLTFGGIIINHAMKTLKMVEVFNALLRYLHKQKFKKLFYKPVPYIYTSAPAEEDLYLLGVQHAKLVRRWVSATITMQNAPVFSSRRKRCIKKALKNQLVVRQSEDYAAFMKILEELLQEKYDSTPVHTFEEITLLAERFPDNIKLFASYQSNKMLAGVLIYENSTIAHCQYIAASDEGKQLGALDIIFDYLIREHYRTKWYFDFGTSMTPDGWMVCEGLIAQKEEFGARAVVCDMYELDV